MLEIESDVSFLIALLSTCKRVINKPYEPLIKYIALQANQWPIRWFRLYYKSSVKSKRCSLVNTSIDQKMVLIQIIMPKQDFFLLLINVNWHEISSRTDNEKVRYECIHQFVHSHSTNYFILKNEIFLKFFTCLLSYLTLWGTFNFSIRSRNCLHAAW